jgi:ATP diphosphatase
MNPLDQALSLGIQASQDGFDWGEPLLAMVKVREEIEELTEALENNVPQAIVDELGDVFFSLVQVARLSGIDSAMALDHANKKFMHRYDGMKNLLINQEFAELSLQEQTILWQRAKQDTP